MDCNSRILPVVLILAVATLLSAAGVADEPWTIDAAATAGPNLIVPSGLSGRFPSSEDQVAESPAEMPIAGTTRPAGETGAVEALSEAARSEASPLPAAETAGNRSTQLEQIAQQADRRTRHGFELAGRGAFLAARSEFLEALGLVAEGLDAEQHSDVHRRAMAAALLALKEAEDFLPSGSRRLSDADLAGVIAIHSTPVLKGVAKTTTSMTALRCYHTFAQEQLAAAAGQEVAGSMALHGTGKLYAALAQKKSALIVAPESKAVVFFQAALLVYPQNYMAANELGVLLAQCGRCADARAMLEHSLSLNRQSTNLHNLAVIYRQLGQAALADQAAQQAARLQQIEIAKRRASTGSANELVQWVDSQAFAQKSTGFSNSLGTMPMTPAGRPAAVVRRPATTPRSASEVNQPASTVVGPTPDKYWPAPTPAAAQRMMWGEPAYQR